MISSLVVFIVVYLLFSLSGILFPIDRKWYASLKNPAWTPAGKVIGLIWAVLYGVIALSLAMVDHKVGLKSTSSVFMILWIINYISNQAFSYFEFRLKRLDLAALDTAVVAVTAFFLIFVTYPYSGVAGLLLIPYLCWTAFATYLAWAIFRMNR